MDKILRGSKEVFVYMDDIVVFANSLEEHDRIIRELFKRLRQAGLKLQPDKCKFLKRSVKYLGHILSEEDLKPDPKKVEAVEKFPICKTLKSVRQFLGLTGYYRRFIKDFAKIAKPLTTLLMKDVPFEWKPETDAAFNVLKTALITASILDPKLDQPYNVTTDASGIAIGGVLSQGPIGKDLSIAYFSARSRTSLRSL